MINVFNISGNTIKVYPASTETIDGGSANAAVELVTAMVQNWLELELVLGDRWDRVVIMFKTLPSMAHFSSRRFETWRNCAVSSAGSDQSGATALTETFNNITTVGGSAQGVKLPTAVGLTIIVANTTTTNCKLYPNTSDTIEGGSANAAVTLPAKTTFTLTCKDATDWTKHRGLAVYNSSGTLIN